MTPARFRWGTLLILAGVVLLLWNLNVVNNNFWADFLTYFPIFLIAIGIEKIFTNTKAHMVAYATTVLLFAGGIWIVMTGSRGGEDDSFFSQTTYSLEREASVGLLQARLDLGHGDLTVRDATDDLVYAQFREFSNKPRISYDIEGDKGILKMVNSGHSWLGGVIKVETGDESDWYLSFSEAVPLVLECFGDESDIHLNLATTPVRNLTVDANDASIYLKLGTLQPDVTVSLTGQNSDVRLRVPTAVGLRVSGIDDEEYLIRLGLSRRDGVFVNEVFDSVASHINVDLDEQLSSLNIDYY